MKLEINYTTIDNYVEFSFCLPINDLFYEKWDEDKPKPDGKEITSISKTLRATFDQGEIEKDYWGQTNNVEVYHSKDDKEVFIMFYLIRDPYDQCDMIYIGVRCNRRDDIEIRDVLLSLYKKGNARSNFEIDYFNQSLYRQIFNSDFYFYKKEQNINRRINHHNLE
jgi:DNA adenine methylase